ncbi:hypothetical protein [Dialister sp.]|uniref:hypothetical protein n=1 Tax=Dialister sp. TaxID=1955814 RepID=UPI002E817216|nr:hypothetical protein [Dialister sp.]MEE3452405.1 hypothetical protein [Dialister sp.]
MNKEKEAELEKYTDYLFNNDFNDENFDSEDHTDHLDCAEKVIEGYAWADIFETWNEFLRKKCTLKEDVINFCQLFIYYCGTDQFIPNPYDFLGYIFAKVDISTCKGRDLEIVDDFAISVLERSGEISLMNNPVYRSWEDPKLLKAMGKYKK